MTSAGSRVSAASDPATPAALALVPAPCRRRHRRALTRRNLGRRPALAAKAATSAAPRSRGRADPAPSPLVERAAFHPTGSSRRRALAPPPRAPRARGCLVLLAPRPRNSAAPTPRRRARAQRRRCRAWPRPVSRRVRRRARRVRQLAALRRFGCAPRRRAANARERSARPTGLVLAPSSADAARRGRRRRRRRGGFARRVRRRSVQAVLRAPRRAAASSALQRVAAAPLVAVSFAAASLLLQRCRERSRFGEVGREHGHPRAGAAERAALESDDAVRSRERARRRRRRRVVEAVVPDHRRRSRQAFAALQLTSRRNSVVGGASRRAPTRERAAAVSCLAHRRRCSGSARETRARSKAMVHRQADCKIAQRASRAGAPGDGEHPFAAGARLAPCAPPRSPRRRSRALPSTSPSSRGAGRAGRAGRRRVGCARAAPTSCVPPAASGAAAREADAARRALEISRVRARKPSPSPLIRREPRAPTRPAPPYCAAAADSAAARSRKLFAAEGAAAARGGAPSR